MIDHRVFGSGTQFDMVFRPQHFARHHPMAQWALAGGDVQIRDGRTSELRENDRVPRKGRRTHVTSPATDPRLA